MVFRLCCEVGLGNCTAEAPGTSFEYLSICGLGKFDQFSDLEIPRQGAKAPVRKKISRILSTIFSALAALASLREIFRISVAVLSRWASEVRKPGITKQ